MNARKLRPGDRVVVKAEQIIPGDGEVIQGVASIDESAITGESAPVICEAQGARSCVSAGARVVSGQIVVQITSGTRISFLDRMILLFRGARQGSKARQKNEQ
jgi:K+-transporting ATPase ATPase B chain